LPNLRPEEFMKQIDEKEANFGVVNQTK